MANVTYTLQTSIYFAEECCAIVNMISFQDLQKSDFYFPVMKVKELTLIELLIHTGDNKLTVSQCNSHYPYFITRSVKVQEVKEYL